MLARYTMYRGRRPPDDPLPDGRRQDIRAHTSHCLRAEKEAVRTYLDAPGEAAWKKLRTAYERSVQARFREDRRPFDELAEAAGREDVYVGCSCPTKKNPSVARCHTVLALRFMKSHYPDLDVRFPPVV